MTYLRTTNTRPNALNWPLGFGDIEKQLDTLFSGLPGFFEAPESGIARTRDRDAKFRWYEKPEAYLVRIDLAGVRKEDVSIELEDGTVNVAAIRAFESKENSEASEVKYAKTFRVPEGVQVDAISAKYEDGVLSLTLPKSEAVKPRQITIG